MVSRMTRDDAFNILSERIRDMCISDLIYGCSKERRTVESMIAVLADINATNEMLVELVGMDGERHAGDGIVSYCGL